MQPNYNECQLHPDLPITAICLDDHMANKPNLCCQTCVTQHVQDCQQSLIIPIKDIFGIMKPNNKTKLCTHEINNYIVQIKDKSEKLINKLELIHETMLKFENSQFEDIDFRKLREVYIFKQVEGEKQLQIEENTLFFNKIQLVCQNLTFDLEYSQNNIIADLNISNEENISVKRKKIITETNQSAKMFEMFLASKIELKMIKGNIKIDIIDTEQMAFKYSANSCFKVAFTSSYKRILFKLKFSLTPKKEILQFYLVPKNLISFFSDPEIFVENQKQICFLKLETMSLKNHKHINEKGLIFVFEQNKNRFLLLLNDKEISTESRINIDRDEEYYLVISVVNSEANFLYLYIENKYQYKQS